MCVLHLYDCTGTFHLEVEAGGFTDSEIIVMLGQNGSGKTTFIKMLAGLQPGDDPEIKVPELNVSYKPQKIVPKSEVSIIVLQSDWRILFWMCVLSF